MRHKREAFKYSVKAADRFVFMGSYRDALMFSRKSYHILTKRDETTDKYEFPDLAPRDFEKLINVVECALRDMAPPLRRSSMKLAYRGLRQKASDRIYQGFQELELELERDVKDFISTFKVNTNHSMKTRSKNDDAFSQKYAVDDVDTYDWEPSYAVQRVNKPVYHGSRADMKSQCIIC